MWDLYRPGGALITFFLFIISFLNYRIKIEEGLDNCSRRALDEEATLRENPESYRLSCVTSCYGDVVVRVQGPVGAAQWTR